MDDFPPLPEVIRPSIAAKLENETILEYTQRIRINTVAAMTGTKYPDDPKEVSALTSLLDGLDRQEINKAKIEIDSTHAQADQEALSLITAIINTVGNINPYESKNPTERILEHDGPVIGGVVLVDGELDTKPRQANYDSFMKQYKKDNPKQQDEDND